MMPWAIAIAGNFSVSWVTYAHVVAWLYGGWWLGFARPHRAAWLGRAHTWPFHCDHAGLDLACLGS
jgi:hypothetical protein